MPSSLIYFLTTSDLTSEKITFFKISTSFSFYLASSLFFFFWTSLDFLAPIFDNFECSLGVLLVKGIKFFSFIFRGYPCDQFHNFSAFFPVNFSQRLIITSTYFGSSSIRKALRLFCSQAIKVVPEPAKISRIMSPGFDEF